MAEGQLADPADSSLGESSDEFFDENLVEREREEGEARLEVAREHVKKQEFLHACIQARLGTQDEEIPTQVLDFEAALGGGSRSQYDVASYNGVGSQERFANACYVAEELDKRQVRAELFQKSKMNYVADEKLAHEKLITTHKNSERQAAKRLAERLADQREKTFLAQQRRGEQQKMLKEIQRDQDRQCDLLQAKHRAALRKNLPPLKKGRMPKSLSCPSSAASTGNSVATLSIANEQIFKDLRKSHDLYNQEMERWEKRAADNERRTEAHRKKMMLGTKTKPEGKSLFKKIVRDLNAMQRLAKRSSQTLSLESAATLADSLHDHAPSFTEDVTQDSEANLADTLRRATTPETESHPLSTAAKWNKKMEDVKIFQDNLVEQARQKLDRDVERLERTRSQGLEKTEERRRGAAALISAWEDKNETAVKRREAAAVTSDEQFNARRQEWNRNREQKLQRQNTARANLFESKREQIKDAVSQSRRLQDESEGIIKEKFQQKDLQANQFLEQKQKEAGIGVFADRAENVLLEKAQACKARKAAMEKEFRRKATNEIQQKQARQASRKPPSPLDARNWEGLDAQRRKPKYAESRKATPNGLLGLLKDAAWTPTTQELDIAAEAAAVDTKVEPDPVVESEPSRWSVSENAEPSRKRMSVLSKRSNAAPHGLTENFDEAERPMGRAPADAQNETASAEPSAASWQLDRDEAGEKEFLDELQAWSVVELRKIRQNDLDVQGC